MSKLTKALTAAAGNAGAGALYVEDVFSTYLYTGNATARDITNGIDLAGEGGLVWVKSRNNAGGHVLIDTERGAGKLLRSNSTDAEADTADTQKTVNGFNDDGFSLGTDSGNWGANFNNYTYASWTFCKAEKFFDVVTWTGDGAATRQISHNLGSTPAVIIIKDLDDGTKGWWTYHQSLGNSQIVALNLTNAKFSYPAVANTDPTDTVFTVSNAASVSNRDGHRFVAYLFASDAGGFGDDGDESIIKCGSYTGNGVNGNSVALGFEPQWLLIKSSSRDSEWAMHDTMRGIATGGGDAPLWANLSNAESTSSSNNVDVRATGFDANGSSGEWNESGQTYIYIAIRRPMKTPESGTEVFTPFAETTAAPTTLNTNFDVDLLWWRNNRTVSGRYFYSNDRLRGNYKQLRLHDTVAEQPQSDPYVVAFDHSDKIVESLSGSGQPAIYYAFKRATGFMDVVAYSGTGVQNHNLGVKPEMVIYKARSTTLGWGVDLTNHFGYLNTNAALISTSVLASRATETTWNPYLSAGADWIAYLFASVDGVSKVGSYTGTGGNVNVDCGFSAGARFILIKRANTTGDWYVWDSVRGIVAGNDPYLLLNSTAGEVTSTDYIDPLASGFTVTSSAPAALNASGGNYIFLAIA
ncbi:hypothetical protein N9985_01995 [Gammaproteobacteria bacterium]|nr:hypothetical protein [Gammaproteobacteria bacterium]